MKSQWALITGASAGFGHAIAEQLAARGMNLVVTARRKERLDELKKQLEFKYKGIQIETWVFDISDRQACEAIFNKNEARLKTIEILVNNAGLASGTDAVAQTKLDDVDAMVDTNVKGLLYMTRAVVPHMIARKSGHIVNLGSVAGRWVYPGGAVYCATKYALRAISEGLRLELMGTGIRLTIISPGMAETEFSLVRLKDEDRAKAVYKGMTPLSAYDIADTVSWCLERPAHVNIQEVIIFPTDQSGVGPAYTFRN